MTKLTKVFVCSSSLTSELRFVLSLSELLRSPSSVSLLHLSLNILKLFFFSHYVTNIRFLICSVKLFFILSNFPNFPMMAGDRTDVTILNWRRQDANSDAN